MNREISEAATDAPDMAQLRQDWDHCLNGRDQTVFTRLQDAVRSRACWWEGQTQDGRRWWKRPKEPQVFPWPGAADSRVPLVDLYTRIDVAMLMTVWRRNKIKVQGIESNDAAWANRMTQLLRWLRYTQIKEYPTEARYLANLIKERGAGVMGVWWVRQEQLGYQVITQQDVLQMSQAAQQALAVQAGPIVPGVLNEQLAELPLVLQDPLREDEALSLAATLYPQTRKPELRKAIKALRAGQDARVVRPYTRMNRPKVCALALNEDIFLPPEATDIDENCSAVHWREQVTEATLEERVRTMGWSEAWKDAVVRHARGAMTVANGTKASRSLQRSSSGHSQVDTSRLFEVIHTYRRQFDENGVPGIWYTVWNPTVAEGPARAGRGDGQDYAIHELLSYDHGEYPFVLFRNEMRTKIVDDSRGIPEVAGTWQQAIKAEWDGRRDRSSITLIPPSYYPPGAEPPEWGPAASIPTSQPERYGYFKGPGWDPGSREIEGTVQRFADRYMGRLVDDGSNQLEATYLQQDAADTWMEGFARVDSQILQLSQQFMPDEFFFRVVGGSKPKPVHATRDEIQGQFDISISYNVSDLDSEVVKEKFGLLKETLTMDRKGSIDINEALSAAYELIDPNLGERLLRPAAEAYQAEIDDEGTVFAKLMSGVDVDIQPGQDYQARLEWLQAMLQRNPTAMTRLQNDPDPTFRTLLEKRVKQLTHQLQQQENAIIGRRGA